MMLKQRRLINHLQYVTSSLPVRLSVASFSTNLQETINNLKAIERKVIWLSAYTVHNANTIRPKRVRFYIA